MRFKIPAVSVITFELSLLASCFPVRADQVSLQRREIAEPEYVCGVGDLIHIGVSDLDDAPQEAIRIDPIGNVDLPLIGSTHVAGLTPTQLKQELTKEYSRYISQPQISLNVVEYQSRPVSVLGSVSHAGVYQMQGPSGLLKYFHSQAEQLRTLAPTSSLHVKSVGVTSKLQVQRQCLREA